MVVCLNREGATGRGHSCGSLIQSPWTLFFFFLLLFNESPSALTGLTGFQSCSETQPACMLGLMCRRGGPKSSPCSPSRDPVIFPSKHSLTLPDNVPPWLRPQVRGWLQSFAQQRPSLRDDTCQSVCPCVSTPFKSLPDMKPKGRTPRRSPMKGVLWDVTPDRCRPRVAHLCRLFLSGEGDWQTLS